MKALTRKEIEVYHACMRKRGYAHLGQARRAAYLASQRTGDDIKHYACRYCGMFHIGHKRSKSND